MKKFRRAFDVFRRLVSLYDFEEIKTPVFEETALFERSLGVSTDVVSKQMYTFEDKSGRSLTLRPEGTAGVVRAAVSGGMLRRRPLRLWYCGPMFRYEKPQKDRRRQFYQMGAEVFGEKGALTDAEIIGLCAGVLKDLGIEFTLKVNSIGCQVCRKVYETALKKYLSEKLDELCSDCRRRYEKNPLRALDCKRESCRAALSDAPLLGDYLCDNCSSDFEELKRLLGKGGLNYEVASKLVRGLDYYNGAVFEFYTPASRDAVAAGGRYDTLVEELGGPAVAAAGFAVGVDRILKSVELPAGRSGCLLAGAGASQEQLYDIAGRIRKAGLVCRISRKKKLGQALAEASAGNFKYAVIAGAEELKRGCVTVKDLDTSSQKESGIDTFTGEL